MEKNWNDLLDELRAIEEEYKRLGLTLTQQGLDAYGKKRREFIKENKQKILDGATQALLSKVEKAQKARELFLEEKRKESESWNAEKLVSEYGITRVQLDMVTLGVDAMAGDLLSKRVERLYKEVKDSKSKYKYRALVDLIPALKAKITNKQDEGLVIDIEEQAKETLQSFRETPEIIRTKDALLNAFDEFSSEMRIYKQASLDVGHGAPDSPFSGGVTGELYNRIKVSQDEESLPVVELLEKDRRFL